jgi:hypothetical protein
VFTSFGAFAEEYICTNENLDGLDDWNITHVYKRTDDGFKKVSKNIYSGMNLPSDWGTTKFKYKILEESDKAIVLLGYINIESGSMRTAIIDKDFGSKIHFNEIILHGVKGLDIQFYGYCIYVD